MKSLTIVALTLCSTLWAQQPADTVVARIDGKPITASELTSFLQANPPEARKNLLSNSESFVRQLGLMRKLAAEAQKTHLDQQSPTKETLDLARTQLELFNMNTLANAQIDATMNSIPVPAAEHKKFYDDHKDRYTQAKVKVLFVSFRASPPPQTTPSAKKILTEPEARTKIDTLLAQIRKGGDFVKLLKENSDDAESVARDGDWGTPIRRSDKLPDDIKSAIFSLKPGQISDPLRVSTGFYLFRFEELTAQPFEEVRDDIFVEIRQTHFNEWLDKMQKSIDVKIENPDFFTKAAGK